MKENHLRLVRQRTSQQLEEAITNLFGTFFEGVGSSCEQRFTKLLEIK